MELKDLQIEIIKEYASLEDEYLDDTSTYDEGRKTASIKKETFPNVVIFAEAICDKKNNLVTNIGICFPNEKEFKDAAEAVIKKYKKGEIKMVKKDTLIIQISQEYKNSNNLIPSTVASTMDEQWNSCLDELEVSMGRLVYFNKQLNKK